LLKKTTKNDNQGFYQSNFVKFLEFRVEKLVSLVRFFKIMNDLFLKFSVAVKLDIIFKWQSCVTSIVSNPKLKTPT
jgi:hypothetical protein